MRKVMKEFFLMLGFYIKRFKNEMKQKIINILNIEKNKFKI